MREILFRGKRLDNGEWIYGYYAKLPHPITAFLKDYIVEVKFDESDVVGNIEYILVDPETVGQFTGVFDNNGNKIFEGDIVSFYEVLGQKGIMPPFKGVVKHGNGYYYVEYINKLNKKGRWNLSSCWHINDNEEERK
jgi:uncharacterized phage protein (TIGR01671 family)